MELQDTIKRIAARKLAFHQLGIRTNDSIKDIKNILFLYKLSCVNK